MYLATEYLTTIIFNFYFYAGFYKKKVPATFVQYFSNRVTYLWGVEITILPSVGLVVAGVDVGVKGFTLAWS